MTMNLTLEEQKALMKKDKIPSNRSFPTCPKGHELAVLCFRTRNKPSTVNRIKNKFYCITCLKIFEPSMKEITL